MDIGNNSTPKNAQIALGLTEIIRDLQRTKKMYPKGKLIMYECRVRELDYDTHEEIHACGTVHCFAGWYGVMHQELYDPIDTYWSYSEACEAIAQKCGFCRPDYMQQWADNNSHLWGNRYGYGMFSTAAAFGNPKNLTDVIAHLKKVVQNLNSQE